MTDKWNIEYTDTFGGEANYCWVRRATIELVPLPNDTVYTSAATIARNRRAYDFAARRDYLPDDNGAVYEWIQP